MTVPFQECQYDEFPRGVSLASSYHGGSRDRDSLRRLTLTRAHPHAIPVHGFQGASRVELDTVVPDVRLTSTFGTPLAKLCNRFVLANDPEICVADSSPRTELSTIAQFCLGLQSHLPLLREEQNVPHNLFQENFRNDDENANNVASVPIFWIFEGLYSLESVESLS